MADEYTPTTDEMADAYTQMRVREAKGETGFDRICTAIDALAEFQRGLAAHETELRERIAQDIARAVGEGTASDIARGAAR